VIKRDLAKLHLTPTGTPTYRGNSKHKNRPANGQKGTLCPEWTHTTPNAGLSHNMHTHDWQATRAETLFKTAEICEGMNRRFATAEGIAFEAKPTKDGTWHGYPIPWEHVPAEIKKGWLANKMVSKRQITRYFSFDKCDVHWALPMDKN
jgi:hypothetical protein